MSIFDNNYLKINKTVTFIDFEGLSDEESSSEKLIKLYSIEGLILLCDLKYYFINKGQRSNSLTTIRREYFDRVCTFAFLSFFSIVY